MADPTKKPVPANLRDWHAEIDGIERFLVNSRKAKPKKGRKWLANMTAYYVARRKHLLANKPPKRYPKNRFDNLI